jgi:hypothetical protein
MGAPVGILRTFAPYVHDGAQAQEYQARFTGTEGIRQFTRVDPENRLVAAELERRWEAALSALKQAEAAYAQPPPQALRLLPLSAELRARFEAVGQHLPQLWHDGVIGQVQKRVLLRALIELMVVHRTAPDQVQVRVVWQGGETTTLSVPVRVGSWAARTGAAEMEAAILSESAAGTSDEEIAQHLTAQGYRSPMAEVVLPSTVRGIRYRHRLLRVLHQSYPRRIAGYLTVPQLAHLLDLTPPWIYDRNHKGTIQVAKDPQQTVA